MTARGCLWHRRSPLKRSTGRPSRQPVEPELQKETDGRIDRSEVRDTPWDPLARKGRWFVWNSRRGNHLGQRSTKPHQQAGHMDASDPIRPSKTLAARGPSTYGSRIALALARLSGTTIGHPPLCWNCPYLRKRQRYCGAIASSESGTMTTPPTVRSAACVACRTNGS